MAGKGNKGSIRAGEVRNPYGAKGKNGQGDKYKIISEVRKLTAIDVSDVMNLILTLSLIHI